jgi:chemotaxis signal transduction protein
VNAVQAVVMPVGADLYALPMSWTREVVPVPAVTPLVTAPPAVTGLFNLRGQIVPLLDTAALLGTGRVETIAFAVVVETQHGLAGLAVTGLPRRQLLDEPIGRSELPGTTGIYQVEQGVAALLDPATLFSSVRGGPSVEPVMVGDG